MKTRSASSLNRIELVLDYIDNSLHRPLSLDELATKSCWSRWQLQRVFQECTQQSVGCYVREQKLAKAAQLVLSNQHRMIDIALMLGFSSEMAFSRAFKSYFQIGPKQYQKRGVSHGIKKPLIKNPFDTDTFDALFVQVRIDYLPDTNIFGVEREINGLVSDNPDYMKTVPQAWQSFEQTYQYKNPTIEQFIGVITESKADPVGSLTYLAGSQQRFEGADCVHLPAQQYAVLSFNGPINQFAKSVEWFVFSWLPQSEYKLAESSELEVYAKNQQKQTLQAEYWLPVL